MQQDPALLDMFSFASTPVWIGIASFVAIGLPFLGVPQLLIRYMSARDDGEIRKARIVSMIVLFVFTFGAVTAGVAGRALFPGLEDPESIFPVISNNLFPPVIAGMLLVVVLSAIMSTVDSLLLLASSSVVLSASTGREPIWAFRAVVSARRRNRAARPRADPTHRLRSRAARRSARCRARARAPR